MEPIAVKLIFMAAVTCCLMARSLPIRIGAYAFTGVCLWLSAFNLAVNNSPVSEEVVRIAVGNDTEDLRNGYYNALGWVVDTFFKDLLHDLDDLDSTIVYTLDHGQGLWEEGDHSTHGKPVNPPPRSGQRPVRSLRDWRRPSARHGTGRARVPTTSGA